MDKIGIFGGGAVGSYLASFMTRQGEDVTLIDQWPEHVEAVRAKGMRVSGTQGPFEVPVNILHIHEAQSIHRPFDIVFIAVKSYDTRWAATFMERFLKPSGRAVSSQNGLNDETLAEVFGAERAIGCVMSGIQVALWEPGHVTRGGQPGRDRGYDVFRVGKLDGSPDPAQERVAELVSSVDGAHVTGNLWGERWAKLALNCMGNPVGAMSGLGHNGQAASANARRLKMLIAREVVQVGAALGHKVEKVSGLDAATWMDLDRGDIMEELDLKLSGASPVDWQASMAQDVIKGRRTEIDQMNGAVTRYGAQVSVPTPVNTAVAALVRAIDAGELRPAEAHLATALGSA